MQRRGTPHNRFPQLTAVASLAVMVSTLAGCWTEGGLGYSDDQFTYVSRPYQPWNVSLKDTRTGQEIWSVEVPVGKQLVIQFRPDKDKANTFTPDVMEWAIMDEGITSETLGNSLPVPPANSRILEPVLRPTPELPPKMTKPAVTSSSGPK